MKPLNHAICSLLKAEIKSSGISYQQLARQTDRSELELRQCLNHHRPFPIATVLELAHALGMPLSQLVAEAERSCQGSSTSKEKPSANQTPVMQPLPLSQR